MKIRVNLAEFWDLAPNKIVFGKERGDENSRILTLSKEAKQQLRDKLPGTKVVFEDVHIGEVESVDGDTATLNLANVAAIAHPCFTFDADEDGNVKRILSVRSATISFLPLTERSVVVAPT